MEGAGGQRATVDRVVSARAWAGSRKLATAVDRWAEMAGPEAANLSVSAVPLGMDWVSVRVSRVEGADHQVVDWKEWLYPNGFNHADQPAVDHFVARELHGAEGRLNGRIGNQTPGRSGLVDPENPDGSEVNGTMAKSNPSGGAKAPEKAKPGTKPLLRAEALPVSKPQAKAKPGTKPKAEAPAVPKPQAKAKPGPKPKAKAGSK